ncbi:MAG TPA: alpha/beta fold hydrolase [Methylotenera sp.]|nr:alpha/beta fold hydrolase [Methylotenera sp.]HPV44065.1 alpha/beta fold hydrolase [Methylotenera sp.]
MNLSMYDTPIEISLDATPTASVIWLHGLGADGNDFVPVVKMLNLPSIRFVLPHAAYKKVTANNGYEMRAWYDVFGFSIGSREDEAGIRESQAYIESLIQREIGRGIPAKRIVLAGFSQGGAIALHTALRHPQPLAGILALSTYLPLKANLAKEKSKANQHIPIFMAHGTYDGVISPDTCRISFDVLQAQHYTINWHKYPMAHAVNQQEIEDIREFLRTTLR